MNDLPLTIADFLALGIVFLSGFLAYFRGAVREFFFLATWGGALAAAAYLYGATFPLVSGWVGGDPLIAAATNAAGLFVVALTVMTLISTVVVKRTEASGLNVLDRSLGFVFGLIRGVLVVCLIYLLYTLLAPVEEHPRWLRDAKLTPAVAEGAETMLALAPEEWGLQGERVVQQLKDTSSTLENLGGTYEDLVDPSPEAPETGNSTEQGYNERDRSALDDKIGAEQ